MIVRDYTEVEAKAADGAEGVSVRWVIGKEEGAPYFAMRVFDVQPGCTTPYHRHWWEHEVFVLGGEGLVKGADGARPLAPGTIVFVPGDEQHQFINTGQSVLQFICVIPHPELEK